MPMRKLSSVLPPNVSYTCSVTFMPCMLSYVTHLEIGRFARKRVGRRRVAGTKLLVELAQLLDIVASLEARGDVRARAWRVTY
jgi:hypothetical protein